MALSDEEMLAMQARKIMEQEAELAQGKEKLHRIKMQLITIGAPLNDNYLEYSREQLKPFFKIRDILDGCSD
jgi:hypothetical protein